MVKEATCWPHPGSSHSYSCGTARETLSRRHSLQKWCPQQARTVLPASRGYPRASTSFALPHTAQLTLVGGRGMVFMSAQSLPQSFQGCRQKAKVTLVVHCQQPTAGAESHWHSAST
eukprot:1539881-Rhodomonas_salina.1